MAATSRVRVLIVDDHPVVREGLRTVLGLRPECEVAGEAADGRSAIESYQRLRPDVVIMDIRLPEIGGIEAIREIRRLDPEARVIAITSYGGDAEWRRALDAGALGLITKGASGEDLVEAVHRVHDGQPYVTADVAAELRASGQWLPLTRREADVLKLMAEGMRNHEIAAALGLSLGTVKVHVNRILEKLDAVDRTEAVTRAIRRGLIELQ